MKVNLKLLKRLYLIDHESGNEHDMISFIINYCCKIPNVTFILDKENNLFITRNTTNPNHYVCVVAHMDTVHNFSSSRELITENGCISAQYISSRINCGLNADDCNGILVALQMLEVHQNLKVCFTTQEEIGGIGASYAGNNYEFFMDVQCMLQADRRGSSDLITRTNGINVTSNTFLDEISFLMKKYKYKEATGTFTDIGILAKDLGLSGVNISCGYYNEHTNKEICCIPELETCLNFVNDIIQVINKKGEFYYITVSKEDTNYMNDDIPCDRYHDWDCIHCEYTNYE